MTDDQNIDETPLDAQEAPQEAPADVVDTDDTKAGDDAQDDGSKAANQAKKYRLRLRETEAERDDLTGRLDAAHKQIAEAMAADRIQKPDALWKAGVDVHELLDDEGRVDPALVKAAADQAAADLGLARNLVRGNHVPNEGSNPRPPASSGMARVIAGE